MPENIKENQLAASGFARNTLMLFSARIGVAVGDALAIVICATLLIAFVLMQSGRKASIRRQEEIAAVIGKADAQSQ
jgi:hypothetical protein